MSHEKHIHISGTSTEPIIAQKPECSSARLAKSGNRPSTLHPPRPLLTQAILKTRRKRVSAAQKLRVVRGAPLGAPWQRSTRWHIWIWSFERGSTSLVRNGLGNPIPTPTPAIRGRRRKGSWVAIPFRNDPGLFIYMYVISRKAATPMLVHDAPSRIPISYPSLQKPINLSQRGPSGSKW